MIQWQAYLQQHQQVFFDDLVALLRIPSVSTTPAHHEDVRQAAMWTADRLRRAGVADVRVMETGGHPLVYAECIESADKPTVLFYGHLDVQPAEPLELWTHPPFEPHRQGDHLYARGASDTKANVLLAIIACEAFLQTGGSLPVNVKFLLESEEEIGSPSLADFIRGHASLLACDLAISTDGGIGTPAEPTIGLGTRGLVGLQLRVVTANSDLHSGMGGLAPNALHVLVSILAALRDADGRILVDGFYDDVAPLSAQDKAIIGAMAPGLEAMMEEAGVTGSTGEPEFTAAERAIARPTLEINGMWGGYQGPGGKTVIAHEAFAKITCRLVVNQDPAKIRQLLTAYIERVTPTYARVSVEVLPGSAFAYHLPPDQPSVISLQRVLQQLTGKVAGFSRTGGSVPVMGILLQQLGVQTVTVGASQHDEHIHAPNEFIRLGNFTWLQSVMCTYLEALGERGSV